MQERHVESSKVSESGRDGERRILTPIDKIGTYHQLTDQSCSLVIAYRAFGFNLTERKIARDLNSSLDAGEGLTWEDVLDHAFMMNFNFVFEWNSSLLSIREQFNKERVIIVGWTSERNDIKGGHFSVVKNMDDRWITLSDPSYGDYVTYLHKHFQKRWNDHEAYRPYLALYLPGKS